MYQLEAGLFVLQPPLPLQEFFPLQPLSLLLQPPWPLQEFWPLQSCLPLSLSSASRPADALPLICVEPLGDEAWSRRAEPDMSPASATPARTALE